MMTKEEKKIYNQQDKRLKEFDKQMNAKFTGIDEEGFICLELPTIRVKKE